MAYTPNDKILRNYADVLVNFALGGGTGIKKGEVVHITASESAKPLFIAVRNAVLDAGGHAIMHYAPDSADPKDSLARYFYQHADDHQLDWFPKKYVRGLVDEIDHVVHLISEANKKELEGIDAKKIMRRGIAWKPFRDWENEKEHKGKFTWTIALYGTPAMAKEAGLSEKGYWDEIVKACFLDKKDPIKEWKNVYKDIEKYRGRLNKLSPKIDKLHVEGADADLWITLGEKRQWLAGSGRNIPSFEIFTSPDWRGTNGWIRFNQPLYRYGAKITGIQLWWKKGRVVKATAKTNEKLLKQMIATKDADKMGEYSLTDSRHSRITKFMAETLFDENMGGPQGNTHLAVGMSYKDSFAGDVSKLTKAQAKKLGFNDSSVHTDIISTTKRKVTAHLKDGSQKVIYKDGRFVL
ncbi:thermophilic metalloprotease (M29) superfamily [Candidatus Kaiserbacteria bacterium RIFCSPHIGHO2_01_FULL_56_24]|uniref:Thermophilic metalloprotease (M29) superfamily n=1 Tax=Candidatus Kaiserbacteria bacterium RIFCSPHIGHO2_01_FULL_56_24 TaxID=1798487 RepID=A0A1F6DG27_9BACT|nr:MAG: thermophilic metalloprotease (M29) superfamily [Candidatus Kaiserbacteria bacterium RIFCSPHIGHO2_01_FULL_56_24]